MTKMMSINEVCNIANVLLSAWEANKSEIKVRGKALFALIGLKKKMEAQLMNVQETISLIAEQNGGTLNQQQTGYTIPEENRDAASQAINDFTRGETEIEYTPIVITEEDSVPVEILDVIFDFVELAV